VVQFEFSQDLWRQDAIAPVYPDNPTLFYSPKDCELPQRAGWLFVFRGLSDDPSGGLATSLGVLQLNVRTKYFVEHFIGFWLRILCIGHGFFDADDLMALRALAEAMTGAIHFVPWSKPSHVGQFWYCHVPSFPQPAPDCYPGGIQTAPLPNPGSIPVFAVLLIV